MIVIRRRLIFWLIKAYLKKSGKTIFFSFLFGLCAFFIIIFASRYFTRIVPAFQKVSIGMVGAYKRDNLPPVILHKLSRGLTSIEKDGSIKPDVASSWEVKNNGKTYIFHLKNNLYFTDGKHVTANDINYNFSDVTIEKPDNYTLVFKLKDTYAPFPATVSRPIFTKGFTGISDYRVDDIKLNGDFVQSISLTAIKNKFDTITYYFYPGEDALKMAFLLGEINQALGLTSTDVKNSSFENFPNAKVYKKTNYSRLVTLFYNTSDNVLAERKIRIAMSYALPDTFTYGQKAFLPYSIDSHYYNYNKDVIDRNQDFNRATLLLSSINTASESANIPDTFTLKTLRKYRGAAKDIADAWKNIGIETKVEETESIPDNFQIFLGDFNIPKDPDQYILWHSGQKNNITKYKNLRIDKLLEQGRKTLNVNERKNIYADFQKFLFEEAPASFLYYPYEYEVVRK